MHYCITGCYLTGDYSVYSFINILLYWSMWLVCQTAVFLIQRSVNTKETKNVMLYNYKKKCVGRLLKFELMHHYHEYKNDTTIIYIKLFVCTFNFSQFFCFYLDIYYSIYIILHLLMALQPFCRNSEIILWGILRFGLIQGNMVTATGWSQDLASLFVKSLEHHDSAFRVCCIFQSLSA